MCLVFRTIVLLSLNWWVISVVAQEKQDVIVRGTAVSSQTNSTLQAQQPLQESKEPVSGSSATDTTKQTVPVPVIIPIPVNAESSLQTPVLSTPVLQTDTTQVPAEIKQPEEIKTLEQEVKKIEQNVKQLEQDVQKVTQEIKEEITQPSAVASEQNFAEIKKEDEQLPFSEIEKKEIAVTPNALEHDSNNVDKQPAQVKEEQQPEEIQEVVQPSPEIKKSEIEKQEEIKPVPMPEEEAEIKGIDTVDLDEPRGNWLFKKIWWGRAENKYEKIRGIFEQILESRILFFTKRSTADKDLFAPFYFEIGMDNGELQGTVAQLIAHIEKERKKEGDLSPASREVYNVLMSEKKSLESINADVLAVNKLDMDIDETLKKLMEQIDLARKYEREAWRSFKEIGYVLSDKKARELYYQMDTAYNNIKDIQEYVGQALVVHLDRVVAAAKNQTERIKTAIDALNKKGHDLRTLIDKISAKPQKPPVVIEEEEIVEPEQEQGFFGNIFSSITSSVVAVWDTIVYVITLPFSWFSSSESSEEVVEESVSESE